MYDLPLILGVIGFCTLIIIVFNVFFVYQPILEIGGNLKQVEERVEELIKRFEPQIKFVESELKSQFSKPFLKSPLNSKLLSLLILIFLVQNL